MPGNQIKKSQKKKNELYVPYEFLLPSDRSESILATVHTDIGASSSTSPSIGTETKNKKDYRDNNCDSCYVI